MPRFKIRVVVRAECEYEVEVEAPLEHLAEDDATAMWRDKLPDDFQVEKGYITDWDCEEVTQLTWECEECSAVIPEAEWKACDELCLKCFNTRDKREVA
jgi:hypothetical protein